MGEKTFLTQLIRIDTTPKVVATPQRDKTRTTSYQLGVNGLLFVLVILVFKLFVDHELNGSVGNAPNARNEPLQWKKNVLGSD